MQCFSIKSAIFAKGHCLDSANSILITANVMETKKITETISAFLHGKATLAETLEAIEAVRGNSTQRESVPVFSTLGNDRTDNLCNVRCEKRILETFGFSVSEEALCERAKEKEWINEDGTPLFRVGCLCEDKGLCVSRRYHATLEDVRLALEQGSGVICAVDGGELAGKSIHETVEDKYVGEIPDHSIIVLSLEDEIVIYNPSCGDAPQRVKRDRFIDAWRDSRFYMVSVNTLEKVVASYHPTPLDLSEVELPKDLDALTEAIAENTHEVWSAGRMREGWTWGPERNDREKKHPDLLPYPALTEGEKEYDRATAMNAIRLIIKLGYKIEKEQ